jgi:hypothetical protein
MKLKSNLVAIQFDAEANCSDENNCRNDDYADNNGRKLNLFGEFDSEKFEGFVSTVVQSASVCTVFAGSSMQF